MELYASGFNAHGQLLPPHRPHDLPRFQKIASGSTTLRVRCATWSATVLEIDGVLELRGSPHHPCRRGKQEKQRGDEREGIRNCNNNNNNAAAAGVVIGGLPADRIKSIVGDAGGVLCALTMEGELWVLDEMQEETTTDDGSIASSLSWVRHDLDFGAIEAAASGRGGLPAREEGEEDGTKRERVMIDQIAVAGNDRVCISIHTHSLTTLLTFPSISSLLSASPTVIATATLPARPTSLLGSCASFQALCDSVPYTWGDARHASLGRNPGSSSPAHTPFPTPPFIDADAQPQGVRKIAAAGWLAAALTRGGECYVWGGRLGERERTIAQCVGDDEELQRFVDVEGGVADVVDVAVGHGWVLVLTQTGKVWGWGDGRWGQLGMKGNEKGWVQGWVELGGWEGEGREVVGVDCGAWNSFVLTRKF